MEDDLRLSASNKRPDPEIAGDAIEGLRVALRHSSEFIKVTVADGWLTLAGDIEWNYQRDRAVKAVRAVQSVVGMSDNLRRKPRVVAADVERHIEDALKRSVEPDANLATVEVGSSVVALKSPRSWAMLDGFSVHRQSVRR